MKTNLSLASVLVVVSLALGGCAAESSEEESSGEETVAVDVHESITPSRLGAGRSGYQPRVMLADLRAAGARCVGTHCDFNGQSWDCSGGGYCSNVSR